VAAGVRVFVGLDGVLGFVDAALAAFAARRLLERLPRAGIAAAGHTGERRLVDRQARPPAPGDHPRALVVGGAVGGLVGGGHGADRLVLREPAGRLRVGRHQSTGESRITGISRAPAQSRYLRQAG
jgi:hypothetical protein